MRKHIKKLPSHHRYSHLLKKKIFRGFTVIVMVVITGILATLATVTVMSLNVDDSFKNAHDSTRKQDLNGLHKALVQYFIDNRCYPTSAHWEDLVCNGPVPEYLQPYMSKIPCDPETGEKYFYEPLDNQCQRCNGGCGVCAGLRLLTHLSVQKDKSGKEVGCNPDSGCGKYDSHGNEYNYGIAFGNSCTIPTPTIKPSPTPTSIINTSTPKPTNAPTTIPTVIPSPTPTTIPVAQNCQGQLLTNGSFETDADNNSIPDSWLQLWGKVYPGEGRICSVATDGNCSNSVCTS